MDTIRRHSASLFITLSNRLRSSGPPDLVAPIVEMENGEQGENHVQGGHGEQRTLESVGHELERVVDDQTSGIDCIVTFVAAQKRLEEHVEDVRLRCGEHYVCDQVLQVHLPGPVSEVGQSVMQHRRLRGLSVMPAERSEERRVGKECRSRWSPYH